MFDLYGCYFMYGDFNSEEYDLVFGNMDTSRLVALESPKNINTVKSRKHNVYYVNRVSYDEEPISFEAEIFTKDTTPIMVDDLPIIERALFNRHSYTKLYQVMSYERDPVYINCILTNPERIESMSGVVGYKFTVNTDSVMAWEETNTQEVNEESTSTTITGGIVSFTDTKEYALKQAIVDIDCVQDLHGYDHPWAGGAGANILPPMVDGTYEGNGVKAVVKDGIATLSGTTTSSGNALIIPLAETITAPSSFYYHIGNSEINASLAPAIENSANTNQNVSYACSPANRITDEITNKVGQTYDRIRFYIANGITIAGTYAPMFLQTSTPQDGYIPYSNICPISGWTGANVYTNGKNLLPPTVQYTETKNDITLTCDGNGNYSLVGTATGGSASFNVALANQSVPIPPNTYIHLRNSTASGNVTVTLRDVPADESGVTTSYFGMNPVNKIISAENVKVVGKVVKSLNFYVANNATVNMTLSISVEPTDAVTDFTEYVSGDVYPISWQTEAGTVYGGTLDVTTGVLTVTHRFTEVSECASVSTASTNVKYAQISFGTGNGADADHSTNVSSKYIQVESAPETDGYYRIVSSYLYIYDNRFTDQTTANSILSAEKPQFVYKLANPQTYQLNPRQIYTLVGNNNIWSDTGNITISYNQTNDFHIDVDTDLDDYIYPDVEIQIGGEGGDIVIYNATDDATRFIEFSSVPPFTTFTMQGSINHITNGMYNHFTSRNFIRLLNGRNNFFMYGDIERITFRFNNRKYM